MIKIRKKTAKKKIVRKINSTITKGLQGEKDVNMGKY